MPMTIHEALGLSNHITVNNNERLFTLLRVNRRSYSILYRYVIYTKLYISIIDIYPSVIELHILS